MTTNRIRIASDSDSTPDSESDSNERTNERTYETGPHGCESGTGPSRARVYEEIDQIATQGHTNQADNAYGTPTMRHLPDLRALVAKPENAA